MKRALLVGAVLGALALPASSQGARVQWYWDHVRAELNVVAAHKAVFAQCRGRGTSIRPEGGRRMFRWFTCELTQADGSSASAELLVVGKNRFRLVKADPAP